MNSKKQVTKYVRELFNRYELNDFGFFVDYNSENEERIEIPLFPYTKMDNETLKRISVYTGLTVSEILNCDQEAAVKYENKYPFISLYRDFKEKWAWYSRYKTKMPTAEEYLFNAIFTDNEGYPVEARYDYADVKKRMIDELKKADAFMPGTYHKDAKITHLIIRTENFFSFPKCKEMVLSFIDMVNTLEKLFFKALSSDLEAYEINELNFLSSILYATDVTMPSVYINYDNICDYKKAYLEENLSDFFSYVKIRTFISSAPWRCKEFFDDMSLVQEFVNIFPQSKAQMRQFAMDVTKFECVFVWSDASEYELPDCDGDIETLDSMLERLKFPPEMRTKEMSRIYVEKNRKEIYGCEKYAKRIRNAAASVSKGGLSLPSRQIDLSNQILNIARMQKRISAKSGGNKQ